MTKQFNAECEIRNAESRANFQKTSNYIPPLLSRQLIQGERQSRATVKLTDFTALKYADIYEAVNIRPYDKSFCFGGITVKLTNNLTRI